MTPDIDLGVRDKAVNKTTKISALIRLKFEKAEAPKRLSVLWPKSWDKLKPSSELFFLFLL